MYFAPLVAALMIAVTHPETPRAGQWLSLVEGIYIAAIGDGP
jgi:hypothetical protein